MPFKSDAQRRFMFAAQDRGEVPQGTAERWARETPNIKSLPERVKKRKKTAAELADAAIAVTPFTGAMQDFIDGGKSARGGIMYEGPFKIAGQMKKTASQIADRVLVKLSEK